MPAIHTLHDLMLHELRDLYSAERQLVQALPKMAKNATSPDLEVAITMHLEETQEHVARLEKCFEVLGASSRGMKCKGMEGLIEEGKSLLEEEIDPEVLDAGIIAAAQRVEHYEIAAYGTVVEYARIMGHDDVRTMLEQTLEEEKAADQKLSSIAEGGINALAERDDQVGMGDSDDEDTGEMEALNDEDSAMASGRKKSTSASRRSSTKKSSR